MLTFRQLRPLSIGFDNFFDFAENLTLKEFDNSFPKYNIVQVSDTSYAIELALAGYSKEDINISFEGGTLTVSHEKQITDDRMYLHRNISQRSFSKSFPLAENIKVSGASFINGLLRIDLEKVIPEDKKKKTISIK